MDIISFEDFKNLLEQNDDNIPKVPQQSIEIYPPPMGPMVPIPQAMTPVAPIRTMTPVRPINMADTRNLQPMPLPTPIHSRIPTPIQMPPLPHALISNMPEPMPPMPPQRLSMHSFPRQASMSLAKSTHSAMWERSDPLSIPMPSLHDIVNRFSVDYIVDYVLGKNKKKRNYIMRKIVRTLAKRSESRKVKRYLRKAEEGLEKEEEERWERERKERKGKVDKLFGTTIKRFDIKDNKDNTSREKSCTFNINKNTLKLEGSRRESYHRDRHRKSNNSFIDIRGGSREYSHRHSHSSKRGKITPKGDTINLKDLNDISDNDDTIIINSTLNKLDRITSINSQNISPPNNPSNISNETTKLTSGLSNNHTPKQQSVPSQSNLNNIQQNKLLPHSSNSNESLAHSNIQTNTINTPNTPPIPNPSINQNKSSSTQAPPKRHPIPVFNVVKLPKSQSFMVGPPIDSLFTQDLGLAFHLHRFPEGRICKYTMRHFAEVNLRRVARFFCADKDCSGKGILVLDDRKFLIEEVCSKKEGEHSYEQVERTGAEKQAFEEFKKREKFNDAQAVRRNGEQFLTFT